MTLHHEADCEHRSRFLVERYGASRLTRDMGYMVRAAAFLVMLVLLQPAANAEGRFALLIGNQSYKESVGRLKNPHNDIALVGATLEKLGFQVTVIKDAGYKRVETALRTHIQQVRRAGKDTLSFVYYSGHGASDPDTRINYLIPVDVDSADDTSLWTNSVELGDVVNRLRDQTPDATHYVVFDACREELRLTREGKKALGAEKGFVPVGNVAGVMVAYATAPGRTASDTGEGAGPYAKALSEELTRPGVEAVTMFRNVQLRVKQTMGQDPWLSFPPLPAVYFAGAMSAEEVELAFWTAVKDSNKPAALGTYLQRYPGGQFASIARALVEHYEQQAKAEQVAREEERKHREEAKKAAEVQRLEEERRSREAIFAQERRRAEQAKSAAELERLAEQEKTELRARAEELRKALEEARVAREAARIAEEERLAAVKTADEATKAAEAAISRKREADKNSDPTKLAALPNIEKAPNPISFDGAWSITWRADPGKCMVTSHTYTIRVARGSITGPSTTSGRIAPTGAARWTAPAISDGTPVHFTGSFGATSGSGRLARPDGRCTGSFSARRG
jgi:hypothetical protein